MITMITSINSPIGFNVAPGSTGQVDIKFGTVASYPRRVRIQKAGTNEDVCPPFEYPGSAAQVARALPSASGTQEQTYNLFVEAKPPTSQGKWVPCKAKVHQSEPELKTVGWEDGGDGNFADVTTVITQVFPGR